MTFYTLFMIQSTLFLLLENIILGQLKLGEHQVKCRALPAEKLKLHCQFKVNKKTINGYFGC